MIDAVSMRQVKMDAEPHPSHRFGEKMSTLVSCASNDRFGSIRECEGCGGREVWAGGAGSHYFDEELLRTCEDAKTAP